MTIDSELGQIAVGDRAAFARLYRATRAEFVRYATGLLAGDHAAAEDAVDDAFVAIWTQSGHFDGHGSANGWIRRIVRNKAIDLLRKRRDLPMSDEPVMVGYANQGLQMLRRRSTARCRCRTPTRCAAPSAPCPSNSGKQSGSVTLKENLWQRSLKSSNALKTPSKPDCSMLAKFWRGL